MANETKPLFRPGAEITVRATANVTGCRLVGVSATRGDDGLIRVAAPAAGTRTLGVAAHDAPAGSAFPIHRQGLMPIEAGGTVTAGQQVECDNLGRVKNLATVDAKPVGLAVESGSLAQLVVIALR